MAALSSKNSVSKPSPKEYWKSRNFHDSERLHLQHWLFQRQFNWLLHPSIQPAARDGAGLRVADLGCANAAWLIELAHHLPNAQLEGFDIAATHFPASEFLPGNVSLHELDILGDIPDHLHGAFDIVDVRAFSTCIVRGETRPFLHAVRTMLKPGGYFQWIEATTGKLRAISPNDGVDKTCSQRLCDWFLARDRARGETFDWHLDMPGHLQREGFEVVYDEFSPIPKMLYKAWNDDLFSVLEQIGRALPEKVDDQQKEDGAMSKAEYETLWNGVLEESQNGVAVTFGDLIVVIGRREGE